MKMIVKNDTNISNIQRRVDGLIDDREFLKDWSR